MVIASVIALAEAGWEFFSVLVVNLFAVVVLFIRQGRIGVKVDQVNTAVNHQPVGSRTLVQRIASIEIDTAAHRLWEHAAFSMLAKQVGCKLPTYPHQEVHEGHRGEGT